MLKLICTLLTLALMEYGVPANADLDFFDGGYQIKTNTYAPGEASYQLEVDSPDPAILSISFTTSGFNIQSFSTYTSHKGFSYQIALPEGGSLANSCNMANVNADNPLAGKVTNCSINGHFYLENLPTANASCCQNGEYQYAVKADFDSNGVGTFTLTPILQDNDQNVTVPRLNIPPFQATWGEFLLLIY